MAEELQHRTRNLFAVMGSIAQLSGRGEQDVGTVVEKIRARIEALGHAHEVSIAGSKRAEAANLHDLVSAILKPYHVEGKRRIVLSGEMVEVPREAVTPIGLVLHELATNALKYGALCVAGGHLRVSWEVEADDGLTLVWEETSGREAPGIPQAGDGSRILKGVLGVAGGSIETDWRPEGLRATVRLTPVP